MAELQPAVPILSKGSGMTDEAKQDAISQSWQALPSIAAIAAWLSGLTVEKWLGLAGIAFLLLQMAGYIWRWRREIRREKLRTRAAVMALHASEQGKASKH